MEGNTNNSTFLTEKEVFDQVVLLQKQLTENSPTSLNRLGDALCGARGEGDALSDDQVCEICKVFAAREETLNQMLHFYHKMYSDLKNEKAVAKIDPTVRQQFLDFVKETTTECDCSQSLPDFDKIWNTVFLGK